MKFLALDPGKSDFAWCAVDGVKLVGLGMFSKPIDDIRDKYVNLKVLAFRKALRRLIKDTFDDKLELIVLERFQQRPGMGGGANAEFINIMIGVILSECSRLGLKSLPVQASTWKNHMANLYDPIVEEVSNKRQSKRKGKPKRLKRTHADRLGFKVTKTSKTAPVKDHEFDAIGIAQWYLETSDVKRRKTTVPQLDNFKSQISKIWNERSKKIAKAKAEAKREKEESKKRKSKKKK